MKRAGERLSLCIPREGGEDKRRDVELYFEDFFFTEPIALSLAENERVVNVQNLGEHRQVWIERVAND